MPKKPQPPQNIEVEFKKLDIIEKVVDYTGRAGFVAALAVPLTPIFLIFRALAGRDTNITASFIASFIVSSGAGGVFSTLLYQLKNRRQSRELERLRQRMEKLEGEKEALQAQLRELRGGS